MVEQRAIQERLKNYGLTKIELLEMFVVEAKGALPLTDSRFEDGLMVAAEKFPLLGVLFDDRDGVKSLGGNFVAPFVEAPLSLLNNGRWGIPNSDPRKNRTEINIKTKLTAEDKEALRKAAEAANKVWGSTAISSQ